MFPVSSVQYGIDCRVANPVFCCQYLRGYDIRDISFSDRVNVVGGQYGRGNGLPVARPSTIYGIGHIVILRTNREVRRIATRGIVALMQNIQSVRDRPVREFVSNSVREGVSFLHGLVKMTISVREAPSIPFPTLILSTDVNLIPEPLTVLDARSVTRNETKRFPGSHTAVLIRSFCNWCPLSASTMAVSVRGITCVHVRSFERIVPHVSMYHKQVNV